MQVYNLSLLVPDSKDMYQYSLEFGLERLNQIQPYEIPPEFKFEFLYADEHRSPKFILTTNQIQIIIMPDYSI